MRSILQLQSICHTVLDVRRKGARLMVRDDHTLILLDYDGMDSRQTMLIAEQFPDVTISVHESKASQSGFCVLFVKQSGLPWYRRRFFMHTTATAAVVVFLFAMLQAMYPHVPHVWGAFAA